EAGGDELVDLAGDQREGEEDAAEGSDLHLREEEFLRRGVDELDPPVGDSCPVRRRLVRNYQEIEDFLGKEETADEGNQKAADAPHQATPQLEQMLHQRGRRSLDVVLGCTHAASSVLRALA